MLLQSAHLSTFDLTEFRYLMWSVQTKASLPLHFIPLKKSWTLIFPLLFASFLGFAANWEGWNILIILKPRGFAYGRPRSGQYMGVCVLHKRNWAGLGSGWSAGWW